MVFKRCPRRQTPTSAVGGAGDRGNQISGADKQNSLLHDFLRSQNDNPVSKGRYVGIHSCLQPPLDVKFSIHSFGDNRELDEQQRKEWSQVNGVDAFGECPALLLAIPPILEALGITAETATLAAGSVAAAGGGYVVGSALTAGGATAPLAPGAYYGGGGGGVNAPPAVVVAAMTTAMASRQPGYWPGPAGAAEWGRRNGVGAREGKTRFHKGVKQADPYSGPLDDYSVNPHTGDVQDPEGKSVGNLEDCGSGK